MNYQNWHSVALELSSQGLSGRKIAKQIGKAKSSVNDVLKAHREGLLELSKKEAKKLKYCYWDLENSLMEGRFFRVRDENIPPHRITKHSHLLSIAWAFNDEEPQSLRMTPEDVKTGNDLALVVKMIEVINEADVIVTYNGKRFDWGVLATRALAYGLPPLKKVAHIDLFQDTKTFRFPSRSMQAVSMYLGLDGKIATSGGYLWEKCADWWKREECEEALIKMEIYNRQDIEATRDLHYRLQGWGTSVNIGTIINELTDDNSLRCVHCGSANISKMDKMTITSTSSFSLYRCDEKDCRGVSRITANGKRLTKVI